MNKQQLLIQSLGEVVLPLVGLFYLDWSLYFIALYYLLDVLANEIFFHVEAKKIFEYNGKKETDKKNWVSGAAIQVILFIALIILAHSVIQNIYPGIDLKTEFFAFLNYTEDFLPIPQGYILIPLVLLPKYMLYKNDFLMRAKFRFLAIEYITFQRKKSLVLTLALIGLIFGISSLVELPEIVWLLTVIIPKLYFDIFLVDR